MCLFENIFIRAVSSKTENERSVYIKFVEQGIPIKRLILNGFCEDKVASSGSDYAIGLSEIIGRWGDRGKRIGAEATSALPASRKRAFARNCKAQEMPRWYRLREEASWHF
jgi:hypothetical protein